jgi:hypothetical protein
MEIKDILRKLLIMEGFDKGILVTRLKLNKRDIL